MTTKPKSSLKHKWKMVGAPGMFDCTYQCSKCKKFHSESVDNPASALPVTGCTGKNVTLRQISLSQKAIRKIVQGKLDRIEDLKSSVQSMQDTCKHPDKITTKNFMFGGYILGWDFHCPDCMKDWHESKEDPYK